MLSKLRLYYKLTKPGIIYGNLIHIVAGGLLAYSVSINWQSFAAVMVGTSLVIASACVANNYIDRKIDAKMDRTTNRAFVTGAISGRAGFIYGAILFVIGFLILTIWTNWQVVTIGLIAYVFYVVIYGWAKRSTVLSTLIGSIPGALPAMAGYVAVSGQVDLLAWAIFLLVFAWQMPHFYAISLFRKKDYLIAGLPVLGVVAPEAAVRNQIIAFIGFYLLVIVNMMVGSYLALLPGSLMLAGGLWWLMSASKRSKNQSVEKWARVIFGRSLVLPILLLVVSGLNIVALS